MSQSHTFRCAFDQSWNIRNNKSTILGVYNTKIGAKRSKMVISDLRPGICDPGKEGGFPYIWKSYKSHICNHLKLQKDLQFLGWLSWLCILWHLHGRCGIMLVPFTSMAAF